MAFQPLYPTLNRRRKETLIPYNQGDQGPFVLDFTTGILDPRLEFSRNSDATFINSQGYVEWSAANNFTNSTFSGSSGTTVPNWSFSVPTGAATVSLSGTQLTITCTTATRARVVQNIGTSTGLPVTTQVKVTARSMAFPLNEVLAYSVNNSSAEQYKVNGTNQSPSYTGWSVGDVISLTCIPTNGLAAQAVIGIGASGTQPAGQSITITDVQAEPGLVARTVIPTGTSGSYQAPRFDYDPTTLQLKGLLIEADITNTINWSETFYTSAQDGSAAFPWVDTNITRNSTNNSSPMVGLSNALRITAAADEAMIRNNPFNMSTDTWTFSIWLRRVSGSGDVQLTVDGTTWTTQTITSSWTRYSLTATGTGWVGVRLVTLGDSIELWGAQRETRPTATSYIPAGRSTATRSADFCRMSVESYPFSSVPSRITLFVEAIPNSNGTSGGGTIFADYARLFSRGANFGHGVELYGYGASTLAIQRKVNASTSNDQTSNSGLAYNTRHKFALSADSGGFFGSANGASGGGSTAAPAALPTSVTHLGVGCNGSTTPQSVMFGILRYIRIWPYAFSQAALNELTTLEPALDLDFTMMSTAADLSSRGITFTRASGSNILGTGPSYIGSNGYVQYAGTNIPRFDYDPTTRQPRGLLIEGSATNIVFRSQEINTSPWFNAGTMTVSQTGSGSPANDATSNVVTWTNSTGAGGAWLQQNIPVSAGNLVVGNPFTWSVWLKSRGNRRVNVFANLQGVTGNREVRVDFGVSPPTVTSTVATGWTSIQAPTIVEYPNGWYKITTGGTVPASTTSVNFGFSNADAVPASGTNGYEAWGFQIEAGSGASSYIPTGASTATRNGDDAVMTNIAALNYSTTNGTLFYAGRFTKINSVSYPTRAGFQQANGTPSFEYFVNSTLMFTAARGASGNPEVSATTSLNADFKWASSFDVSLATQEVKASLNGGGLIASGSSGLTATNAATQFAIGRAGYAAYYPSGTIRQIKYWPNTLEFSQLQAITT